MAQFSLTITPILFFFLHCLFFFFFVLAFRFLIFQRLRCSGSLKRPWGLRVLAFVSHFLLKQFFFNPMQLFTVVVLALSSLSLFLLLSFSLPPPHPPPQHPPLPPSAFSVSARGQCYTFSSTCKKAGGIFFSYCNLKIEKKKKSDSRLGPRCLYKYNGLPLSSN